MPSVPPTTDDKPSPGAANSLERRHNEQHKHHRAMLLWAMQDPASRSMRAVARAVGCSEGTIRNWRRAGTWDVRADDHGAQSDLDALDMYRAMYMLDHGKNEMPHTAQNVVRALGALDLDDPTATAAHLARVRVHGAIPGAAHEIAQVTAQAVATHRHDVRKDAERHVRLLDGALGLIAKKLKANEVRVSVRDIPVLLECRAELVQVIGGHTGAGNTPVIESARVTHAKKTGGDVVSAMRDDAEDVLIILNALCTSQGADLGKLAAEDERARAELQQEAPA